MKADIIRRIFLAVYVAISIATFYHSAWGFALLAGNPPTDTFPLAFWWIIGGAQAAAIDIGMGAIVYAMLHGWERGWLVKSLFLLAGFSAYSQLVYSTAHAVAFPLGAVPDWLKWLGVALDLRTLLFPLALPGFALIYAFAAKGEFATGPDGKEAAGSAEINAEIPAAKPVKTVPVIGKVPATKPRKAKKPGGKTRDKALEILAADPDISGGELGRRLGKSESSGRKLRAELLPVAQSAGEPVHLNGNGGHE